MVETRAPAQEAGRTQVAAEGEGVVELEARGIPRTLPPAVRRHDQRQAADQVRRVSAQAMAFAEAPVDKPGLPRAQIAHATVDQLGAAAGGSAGEVAALDEEGAVSAGGSVECGRKPGAAAPDHDNVPGAHLRGAFEHVCPGKRVTGFAKLVVQRDCRSVMKSGPM